MWSLQAVLTPLLLSTTIIRLIYAQYTLHEIYLSYDDAMSYCRENYATTLAIFRSASEAQEIRDLVATLGGNQRAWVGLSDRYTPNLWKFEDEFATRDFCNGNCNDANIDYWGPSEPGSEECAVARAKSWGLNDLLADIICAETIRFICHKDVVWPIGQQVFSLPGIICAEVNNI